MLDKPGYPKGSRSDLVRRYIISSGPVEFEKEVAPRVLSHVGQDVFKTSGFDFPSTGLRSQHERNLARPE